MAVPIRYTRTSDGVNIAYADTGEGEPVVYLQALPWSNLAVSYSNPLTACHAVDLTSFARLLAYDARGCGLSDHDAADLTLEGFARDIDAVADAAGCRQFTLYGSADGCRVAAHYAATRPERVTRLVLWLPSVDASAIREDPVIAAVRPLVKSDWELYLQTVSHAVIGGWDAERAPYAAGFADIMRGGIRHEEFPRMSRAMRDHGVAKDLPRIVSPTLVMTRERAAVYTVPVVSEVAAAIPGARLVVVDGNWLMPCVDDTVAHEIATFMGTRVGRAPYQPEVERPGFASAPYAGGISLCDKLSPREAEVLLLIADGRTNAEIADTLVIAHSTASRHVHNILNKLGMSRRAEAATFAAIEGLVGGRSTAGT